MKLKFPARSHPLTFIQTQGVSAEVLKSHLKLLKQSLCTRPPTSGVQRRIGRAGVLTQHRHKGIFIEPKPNFEDKIT